ncbi:hypothetical protein A3K63_03950 [Candidatus Micrarchaeota archaeon RBG_16_49_10]|nr:MAG: hypothetical protein A3K63_03950 [Candidatus Micrarchaeota archaeon RBG_16_49_10]
MLEFCGQCGNVMVLKTRNGDLGTYACRKCGSMRALPFEKIEIVEKMQSTSMEPLVLFNPKKLF